MDEWDVAERVHRLCMIGSGERETMEESKQDLEQEMTQGGFTKACEAEHHMGLAFINSRIMSGKNPAVVLFSLAMAAALVSRQAFADMASSPERRRQIADNFDSTIRNLIEQPYDQPSPRGGPVEVFDGR